MARTPTDLPIPFLLLGLDLRGGGGAESDPVRAAHRRLWFERGFGLGEVVEADQTSNGGGVEMDFETALHLAGGKAVAGRRAAWRGTCGAGRDLRWPRGGMITARGAWPAAALAKLGAGAQIIGIELAAASEAAATNPAQLGATKGGKDFANETWSKAVDELPILFYAAKMLIRVAGREPATARRRSSRLE